MANRRAIPAAASVVVTTCAIVMFCLAKRRKRPRLGSFAYENRIGNTPTILLPRLSELLGCQIYVKLENTNPGGTGKDRAALRMIEFAEKSGILPPPLLSNNLSHPSVMEFSGPGKDKELQLIQAAMKHSQTGGLVVEGTSGSTGIALATLCIAKGHAILVVLPDDQADEKSQLLRTLGAIVHIVPVTSISHPNHYVKTAQRIAHRARSEYSVSTLFPNQFENLNNYQVHFETTGPEIYRHRPHIFVMSAGTGGTISGVGNYLKSRNKHTKIILVDPEGSVLSSKINHGVAFTIQQTERSLLRHRYDSIAEGIGLDRLTSNFKAGMESIDKARIILDQEAVDMAHWILHNEGLLIGSSSAMNLVGAVKESEPGRRVLTILCDSGQRHLTRFWNRDFLDSRNLSWPSSGHVPGFLQNKIQ